MIVISDFEDLYLITLLEAQILRRNCRVVILSHQDAEHRLPTTSRAQRVMPHFHGTLGLCSQNWHEKIVTCTEGTLRQVTLNALLTLTALVYLVQELLIVLRTVPLRVIKVN